MVPVVMELTPDQYDKVAAKAKEADLSVVDWCKRELLKEAALNLNVNPYLSNEMRRRNEPGADQARLC